MKNFSFKKETIAGIILWSVGLLLLLDYCTPQEVAVIERDATFIELYNDSIESSSESDTFKELAIDMGNNDPDFLIDLGEKYCAAKREGATEQQINEELAKRLVPAGGIITEEDKARFYLSSGVFDHVRKVSKKFYNSCGY